jgi:hypothetical protein
MRTFFLKGLNMLMNRDFHFKKHWAIEVLVISAIILVACKAETISTPTTTLTLSYTSTATSTKIPATPTLTPSPTPTLSLPVGQLTPIPASSKKINAGNVKDLQEIAQYRLPMQGQYAYTKEYYFDFRDDNFLSFKIFSSETDQRISCDLSLATGSLDCQSHKNENSNGRYIGKDIILATDGKYYGYEVGKDKVDIYPIENPNHVFYSIPHHSYGFELIALDLQNNIAIYEVNYDVHTLRSVIQDMQNDHILTKWEGTTWIYNIEISDDQKYTAMCLKTNNTYGNLKRDRLLLFDNSTKKTVYYVDFNCSHSDLGFSSDSSELAIEYIDTSWITRLMILQTTRPFENWKMDFDEFYDDRTITYSPDGTILVIKCNEAELCFLDPSNGNIIYRFKTHPEVTNLAFSKDGSLFATSSMEGLISIWAVPPFTNRIDQNA